MLAVKLDRDLNLIFLFFVLIFVMNQQRNFLVTVGEDEQISPQQSAMCLKVFDLDKMQSEGTSAATTPDCIGILRIFTNQFPEANVFSSFRSFFLSFPDIYLVCCFKYSLIVQTKFVCGKMDILKNCGNLCRLLLF